MALDYPASYKHTISGECRKEDINFTVVQWNDFHSTYFTTFDRQLNTESWIQWAENSELKTVSWIKSAENSQQYSQQYSQLYTVSLKLETVSWIKSAENIQLNKVSWRQSDD